MDTSSDGTGPVVAEETPQPERKSARRKLVQSTLFPHKSPEIELNSEKKLYKNCNGEDDDYQDEEYRGSQNKKRKQKGKTTPETRTPKKSVLSQHKSPDMESNCDQKREKECNVEDGDGEDEECCGSQKKRTRIGKATPQSRTPKKSKEKSPMNGTRKKNGSSNGKGISNLVGNQGVSPPIRNLRSEAKMTAEENSRMFAGKQIHPFFSACKVSKRCNETTDVENNCCWAQRKYKGINIGPIHVFERDQDDARPLDWSDWTVCEKPFIDSSCSLEGCYSSNFEGLIGSLDINDFPSSSHPPGTSLLRDNASLDQCQQEFVCEARATVSSSSSDAQVGCCQLAEDTETACITAPVNYLDREVVEVGFFSGSARKSDAEQQSDLLQERTVQSYLSGTTQLEDRLWTDKYQPKRATEVCGNDESVKLLSEWLRSWQQRGHQACRDTYSSDICDRQDADYNCFQGDSDSKKNNEGGSLKNVLLITGPTGSGKSAAIYACAKEEGFKVLEVNASECRNGAVVKQRFGEALESHSLGWSQDTHVEPQSNNITKFSRVLPDGKVAQYFCSKMIEVIPTLDEGNSLVATEATVKFDSKDSTIACGQGQLKHLILFEDVDITFTEDHGFVAAIQKIAEKAKGPMILTSNSENPVLPANLDRLEVCFVLPSEKELLRLADMVCTVEKVSIQAHLLEQVIDYCQGDIRKTIMHLQFWFQSKQIRKLFPSRGAQRLFGSLMFDPEVVHQVLPKMMPWDFPCRLSKIVEKEITTSLSMMVENSVALEVIKEDFEDKEMQNNIKIYNYGKDSIEAKKEAMFSQNCSDNDRNHFKIPYDAVCDVFDSPGTLLSFSLRKSRRKLDVVMSTDSEDELVNDRVTLTTARDTNYELILEADDGFLFHCPSTQPSSDMQLCSRVEKLDENHSQCPDMAIDLHVKETCMSVDASCVPESTFVPETEINDGTEVSFSMLSCTQVASALEEVSVTNESKQRLWPVETDDLDKSEPKLQHNSDMLGNTSDVIAELCHVEVEDSQNEHVGALTREYQVMDECSRVGFNEKSKPVEKFRSCMMTDLVRESWRKLCDRRTDLTHFVTSEVKNATGMTELAYGMSNLISEAEILLSKHQNLDSLKLSMVHSEVLDASSWSDEHLQMSSTIAQQGFCFYAKEIASLGLKIGLDSNVDFTREILSTASQMEVGNFTQNLSSKSSHSRMSTEMSQPESGPSSNSEMKSRLLYTIQSIVPSRSYMTMKGDAFYEYLSSLGHIARSEASRLSASIGNGKRRRARASRNYLSNGSLMLSPEEISLLGRSNIYPKILSQSMDSTDKTI